MISHTTKNRLKAGSALKAIVFIGFAAFQGEAHAGSVCTNNILITPRTFHCIDAVVTTAAGTYSAGATFTPNLNGGLALSSTGTLAVTMTGQVNSSTILTTGWSSALDLTTTGSLSLANTGTVNASSGSTIVGINLRGSQITNAQTGTIVANGGYATTGVYAEATNGNASVTGGTTTVSGLWSRGLWTDAFGGNNITNTGQVTATGAWSRGVVARALSNSGGCTAGANPSLAVNVTGNVSAEFVAINTVSCGSSTVDVQAGTTVQTTGSDGQSIRNIGTTATTTINGSVLAASTADRALDVRSTASTTTIGSTGLLSGTFAGDEGNDQFSVSSGGTWTSSGVSEFRGGDDTFTNSGTMNASSASLAGLESFQNAGTLNIVGGTFVLPDSTLFENTGTINAASGSTTITSAAAFYNNGVISLINGHAGDVLTITNDYVAGPNAALLIEADSNFSDSLFVSGTTTGTTQIYVSAPASLMGSRILIATSDGSTELSVDPSSTSTMSFAVTNQATKLIGFKLTAADGNIYLMTAPNELAFEPLSLGLVSNEIWAQSARVIAANAFPASGSEKKLSVWGQAYLASDRSGETDNTPAFDTDTEIDGRLKTFRKGIQVGLDARVGRNTRVGITGGYETANADFRGLAGGINADGFNLGAYLAYGGDRGFHGALLVKLDESKAKLKGEAFANASRNPDLRAKGFALDAGYRFGAGNVRFDALAQLTYSRSTIEGFSAEGIEYSVGSVKGWSGALGLRADLEAGSLAPFASAKLWHDTGYDRTARLISGDVSDMVKVNGTRTWVSVEAGLDPVDNRGPSIAAWADFGDVRGLGLRAGWRF